MIRRTLIGLAAALVATAVQAQVPAPVASPTVPPAIKPHPRVKLETAQGVIVIELFPDKAPITVANYLKYVDRGLFNGATFYRASRPPGYAADDYGLIQGEANAIAPGKRMLSAMTPAIVVNPAGRLELVVGAPGGPRIISAVTQVISNIIDHGMDLAQAITAPRIHHQALPDSIRWENNGVSPEVRRQLEAMGHHFFTHPAGSRGCENRPPYAAPGCNNAVIEAVRVTARGLEGFTDPRIPSRAAGY